MKINKTESSLRQDNDHCPKIITKIFKCYIKKEMIDFFIYIYIISMIQEGKMTQGFRFGRAGGREGGRGRGVAEGLGIGLRD